MKQMLVALVILASSSCAVVTPRDDTRNKILDVFRRIQIYFQKNGRLPTSLDELAEIKGQWASTYLGGRENSSADAWGRRLEYSVDASGLIALTSLGLDGKPGGTGFNADMSITYAS